MRKLLFMSIVAATVGMVTGAANAQVEPISYGGSYSENFDSIGPTGTWAPAGWIIGPSNPTS